MLVALGPLTLSISFDPTLESTLRPFLKVFQLDHGDADYHLYWGWSTQPVEPEVGAELFAARRDGQALIIEQAGTHIIRYEDPTKCSLLMDPRLRDESTDRWRDTLKMVCGLFAVLNQQFFVHAAALAHAGRAALILGRSGAGKSTLASAFDPAWVINDDFVWLHCHEGDWVVDSTPFSSTSGLELRPQRARVTDLVFLSAWGELSLESFEKREMLRVIVEQAALPMGIDDLDQSYFHRAVELVQSLPAWQLAFGLNHELTREFLGRKFWGLGQPPISGETHAC